MMFDPMYLLFLAPGLALSLWASFKTKSAFNKYSKVRVATGLTGAQAAQRMLTAAGISDVKIVPHQGTLSDHYNPITKTLALSEPVYGIASIAAVGVACHEAGHAIQHAVDALALLRHHDAVLHAEPLGAVRGIELDRQGHELEEDDHREQRHADGEELHRAEHQAEGHHQVADRGADVRRRHQHRAQPEGLVGAGVLNAAALTYVAAAISSLLTLLYFLFRSGLLGGRSRD